MRRLMREAFGIIWLFAALIAIFALATFHVDDPGWSHTGANSVDIHNSVGRAGAWFADISFYLLGYMAYLIPVVLLVGGLLLVRERKPQQGGYQPFMFVRVIGVALMLTAAAGLADLHVGVPVGALPDETYGGGVLGMATAWHLVAFLNPLGTTLLLLAVFVCSLTLAFGTSWIQMMESLGGSILRVGQWLRRLLGRAADRRSEHARIRAADKAREAHVSTVAHAANDSSTTGSGHLGDRAAETYGVAGLIKRLGNSLARLGSSIHQLIARIAHGPQPLPEDHLQIDASRRGARFDHVADALSHVGHGGADTQDEPTATPLAATAARVALQRAGGESSNAASEDVQPLPTTPPLPILNCRRCHC